MQIPPDIERGGPILDKLLGDIVLSMGRHIFPGVIRTLGFVTHHKDTEASLTNFFGSIESRDKPPSTASLWDAVEARLLRFPEAHHNRRGTMRYNPYEDPTQLGRVMREQGRWPELLHWVSIIKATKAVGPTQGLTVYINTKYSDFMGDVPGGQDRAMSALSRSLGVMVIVSPPTLFIDHEYKARDSIWLGRKQRTGRGGGTNDKPPAIRSLAPAQLPQWTMPLNVDAWPKPAEAFVSGVKK